MKKINMLASILTILLVLSTSPVTSAAVTITLTVIPSANTASLGDEILFTVGMSNLAGSNLGAFSFELSIPRGLEYITGSGAVNPAFREAIGLTVVEFDEDPRLLVSGFGDSEYNGADIDVATFVCKVTEEGNKTVSLKNTDLIDSAANPINKDIVPAVIAIPYSKGDTVFDGKTWLIPPDADDEIHLSLDGWTVEIVFYSHSYGDILLVSHDKTDITVIPDSGAFGAIVKMKNTKTGIMRYFGIEKPMSVAAETPVVNKTWIIPSDYTNDAKMQFFNWKVTELLTNAPETAYEISESEIRVKSTAEPFEAIVKLSNSLDKVMYVGIEKR